MEVFRDDGVSGELLERPGLQALLAAVESGFVDLVVCYDPDRLARKVAHQIVITERIERAGARLEFVNFDWQDTPEGRLFYTLRGAIAEYEKEKIKMRTRLGRLAKLKKGEKSHNVPVYGYRQVPGGFEVHEEEARVVRRIFELAAAGWGPQRIALRLEEEGVPGPRGPYWHRNTVRRIIINPVYMGLMHFNRFDTAGTHNNRFLEPARKVPRRIRPREEWISVRTPAIVSKELWERAQEFVAARTWSATKPTVHRYLLSGLCWCGVCGSKARGTVAKASAERRRRRDYRYYVCNRRSSGRDYPLDGRRVCRSRGVNADALEEVVWSAVKQWLADPGALAEELKSQFRLDTIRDECQFLEKRLGELDGEKERAIALYVRGIIGMDECESLVAGIRKRRGELEKRLEEAKQQLEKLELNAAEKEGLMALAADYAGRLDELSFEERAHVVRVLVSGIYLYPDRVEICARVPCERVTDRVFASGNNHVAICLC